MMDDARQYYEEVYGEPLEAVEIRLMKMEREEQAEADSRMALVVWGFVGMALAGFFILGVKELIRLVSR